MGNDTVTVVIPAYNAVGTIAAALDSVAAQTFRDTEIIVVDDASSDGTARAVEGWGGGAVRFIRQERNTGPAGARNRGIAESRGEWIAFLDGDDEWLPRRLELQLGLAAKHPGIVLWCGEAVREEEGGRREPGSPAPGEPSFRVLQLGDFVDRNMVATSTVLVRREVLEAAGGFDPQFRGPEDYDLWIRIAAKGGIGFVAAPLSRYRYRPGSLSMDDRRFLPEVLRVLDKAFGPGGALRGVRRLRRRARATQYFSASWMAFHRGDRPAAVRLLLRSWLICPGPVSKERETGDRLLRLRLLWRYVTGVKGG